MDFKRYRIVTSMVLLMSSFVFAQDVTSSPMIKMNLIDKMSLSVYCGLSRVFSPNNRSKCYIENMPEPVMVVKRLPPTNSNAGQVGQLTVPSPSEVAVATNTVPAVNLVLEEIKKKLADNTEAIEKLDKRTTTLESRAGGQTIVKYVSNGSRGPVGPKGADGVTTIIYATPTPEMFNNLSGSILIGQNNQSFANNNISVGRDIINTVDNSLQIGPSDVAKVTITPGATSGDMSVSATGRFVANAFCIDDVCIDKNILKKVVDMFK